MPPLHVGGYPAIYIAHLRGGVVTCIASYRFVDCVRKVVDVPPYPLSLYLSLM